MLHPPLRNNTTLVFGLEIEKATSHKTKKNVDDEDQRHLSEIIGSFAISATSSSASPSFSSAGDSFVSISFCQPDSKLHMMMRILPSYTKATKELQIDETKKYQQVHPLLGTYMII